MDVPEGEDLDRYLLGLLRREIAGERATIEVGPYTAVLLWGAIDVVLLRSLPPEQGAAMLERVLDQLKLMFIDDPVATALIHQDEQRRRRGGPHQAG